MLWVASLSELLLWVLELPTLSINCYKYFLYLISTDYLSISPKTTLQMRCDATYLGRSNTTATFIFLFRKYAVFSSFCPSKNIFVSQSTCTHTQTNTTCCHLYDAFIPNIIWLSGISYMMRKSFQWLQEFNRMLKNRN